MQKKRFQDVYQTRETWWRTNVEEHPDGQVGFFFDSSNKVYLISGQLRLGQEVWCLHLIFLVLFLIMQAKGVRNRGTFKIWVNRTVSATLKQHHSISPHSFVSCNCWVSSRFVPVPPTPTSLSLAPSSTRITIPNIPYWAGAAAMVDQVLEELQQKNS